MRKNKNIVRMFIACMLIVISQTPVFSQSPGPYIRVARITIDSTQLDGYKAALKKEMETAVRVEPGVLSMFAVYNGDLKHHVEVFEVYKDEDAYKSHLETPHFKEYKNTTKDMVHYLILHTAIPVAGNSKLLNEKPFIMFYKYLVDSAKFESYKAALREE